MTATPPLGNGPLSDNEEVDLRELLGALMSARYLILAIALSMVVLGGLYALLATPIYQVDAVVQVEDSKGSALGAMTKDFAGLFDVQSLATTEIQLIQSRMVMGSTVAALKLDLVVEPNYFPLIGRFIATRFKGTGVAEGWPGFRRFAWGGEILDVSRLDVPEDWLEESLTLVVGEKGGYTLYDPDGNLLGHAQVGQVFTKALSTEANAAKVELFVRDMAAAPGVEFSLTKLPRLKAIQDIEDNFSAAEQGKQSGIIYLTLQDKSPDLAVQTLNTIINYYVRQNVERKSAEAEQTLQYLDQQLPQVKQQLEASEVRFNDFRSRHGSLDVSKEGELLLQQSVTTETGLVELEQKRKELLQRFTPEHPSVKALDSQIAILQDQSKKFSGQMDSLPQTQQEVLRLMRDLQVSQELYTSMLNNAQQLKVVRGGTVGNVRVIDYAERPIKPVQPKKAMVLAISLVLGLGLGVMAAFLRHALRRGVKDPRQIEARTGLSVFATIPHSSLQEELYRRRSRGSGELLVLAQKDDQDLAIESLRSLRTSLHFASLDAANNRLMVTGSAPGVGKSFISVNLAAVLVQSGARVLLIDADMRRGHLNEFFGRPRGRGLSDVIASVEKLEDAIVHSALSGLDILTTGAIPPNPSELLLHPNFTKLLEDASTRYDHVIIDCPPIMAVTDAAIVGRHVGMVLLTARFFRTPLAEVESSVARLRQAGVNVSGVLLNGVDDSMGYGYGYKSTYAYSYRSHKD